MWTNISVTTLLVLTAGCIEGQRAVIVADSGAPDVGTEDDVGGSTAENAPPPLELSTENMQLHLQALMDIAEANDGNRAAGTPGFAASVDYVQNVLEEAGYTVTPHEFNIVNEEWEETPQLKIDGQDGYRLENDFFPLSYTGSGSLSAPVIAVDILIPPGGENESTSGCESDDFVDFPEGAIALLQRGECTFQTKAQNAVDAGAVAVLIFNEGQPGRRDVFAGALDESYENPVPVFALSYDVGVALSELSEEQTVTVDAQVLYAAIPTFNLMADTTGDPTRIVVVGAHLDSVGAGPGINDNGSGVAMILEMAVQIANAGIAPNNQIRFSFWGGEELGLLGSMDYVFGMDERERSSIMANLNFDMIASPNPARMVYDGSGSLGGESGPPGSAEIEAIFARWFENEGLAFQETPFDGRSDYGPFIWTGIPAGGLFTGAEQSMSGSEAGTYDGDAGTPYDACYHERCDTIDNVDLVMLGEMADAAVDATLRLGFLEGELAGGPLGPPSTERIAPELPDAMPSGCGAHEPVWRR